MAQEVAPVIPEWIKTQADGTKMLEKVGVEAILVEAIQLFSYHQYYDGIGTILALQRPFTYSFWKAKKNSNYHQDFSF